MDKTTMIAVSVISVSTLIGLTPFILNQTTLNTQETILETSAEVISKNASGENIDLGLKIEKSLNFGKMPVNVSAAKTINLTSSKKSSVQVSSTGNISEFLDYDRRSYFEGSRDLEIQMVAEKPGYYAGELVIKTQTPKNKIGETWLELKQSFF